jgi:hypothetical protein
MEEKQDNITPADDTPENTEPAGNDPSAGSSEMNPPQTPSATPPPAETNGATEAAAASDERMNDRLERLGGEPAPVITPEEFARLQQAGQVHIDSRGRVRTARRSDAEAGVSLRKRRAWYGR